MDAQDVEDRLAHRALVLDRLRNPAYRPYGKGVLGRSLKEMGVPTLLSRVAKSRGLDVDGNGRMRCPEGYQNGGEFTDINLTNCGKQMVQGALRGVARLEANVSTMRESKRRESNLSAVKEQVASMLSPRRHRIRQTDDLLDVDMSRPLSAQVKEIRRQRPKGRKLFGYEYGPDEIETLRPEGLDDDRYVRTLGMAIAVDAAESIGADQTLLRSEVEAIEKEIAERLKQRMDEIAKEISESNFDLYGLEYENRFLDIDPVTGVMYGRFAFGKDGSLDPENFSRTSFTRVVYSVPLELVPESQKRSAVKVQTDDGDFDLDARPDLQEIINSRLGEIEILGLDHQMALDDLQRQTLSMDDANRRREALYESLRKAGFEPGKFDLDSFIFPKTRAERRADLLDRIEMLADLQDDVGDFETDSIVYRLNKALRDYEGAPSEFAKEYHEEELRILSEELRRRGALPDALLPMLPDFDKDDSTRHAAELRASLERIAPLLPAQWTRLGRRVEFQVGGSRGYNQKRPGGIDLIMIPERFLDDPDDLDSLMLHEYVHSIQRDNSRVAEAEFAFWSRVTGDDETQPLGNGYDDDEIAKPDDFDNAYMGKVYQGNERSVVPKEILPVLMEMLHGGRMSFSGDNDALYWLLGMMASAKD